MFPLAKNGVLLLFLFLKLPVPYIRNEEYTPTVDS
jgi:hypothetical protein